MRANEISTFALNHEDTAHLIETDNPNVQTALAAVNTISAKGPELRLVSLYESRLNRVLQTLHPSRRTGHLRLPHEAESGSLALRLVCSPMPRLRQMDCSILRLPGYISEQAIYVVNSFQFTRSARLTWRTDCLGAVGGHRDSRKRLCTHCR